MVPGGTSDFLAASTNPMRLSSFSFEPGQNLPGFVRSIARSSSTSNPCLYFASDCRIDAGATCIYTRVASALVIAAGNWTMSAISKRRGPAMSSIANRIDAVDWSSANESLSARGYAVTSPILMIEECAEITALYSDVSRFRSHVIMERHRFGVGDYKYFANPLPPLVADLRTSAYPHLAKVANAWGSAFGETQALYPSEHDAFLKLCHKA